MRSLDVREERDFVFVDLDHQVSNNYLFVLKMSQNNFDYVQFIILSKTNRIWKVIKVDFN